MSSIPNNFIVKSGLTVQGTATSISTNTGAALIAGGLGVGQNINAGGKSQFGINPIYVGVGSTSSITTQTMIVNGGGAAIVGDSYINGALAISGVTYLTNQSNASSTNTGALQIAGGFGVGGTGYIGGNLYVGGSQVITQGTLANQGVTAIYAGTDTAVNTSTGAVTIWNTSTLQSITNRGSSTTNAISITNATASISSTTGALTVAGGVGIQGSLNVGTTASIAGLITAAAGAFTNTVDATTTTNGVVTIAGGLGVAKTIYANAEVIAGSAASVSTTASNALSIPNGGLGVGGTALIGGQTVIQSTLNSVTTNTGQALLVSGGVGVIGNVVAGQLISSSNAQATTAGVGSLQVAGGGYFGNNLVVMGTAASTGTTVSNALYVAGGAGIQGSLLVGGPATFSSAVTFNGPATYVYSTNTYYTDNLLEIHVPPGGVGSTWASDDGKDIGIRIHYYNGGDQNAALILADNSKNLEWYATGSENAAGDFVGGTYGTFKTGAVKLVGNATNNQNTNTGDLQVLGGVGINSTVFVGGTGGTASSSTVGTQSLIINNGGLAVNGDSYFNNTVGISNILKVSGGAGSTTNGTTQGLQVTAGGIAVTGASYINAAVAITGVTTVTNTTNAVSTASGALQVAGGAGIGKDLYVGGTVYGNATSANTATNLAGGAVGSIPYQLLPGQTNFISISPIAGYVLTSNGTTATWVNPNASASGTATNALNILSTTTNLNANFYVGFLNTTSGYSPEYTDSSLSFNPSTHILTVGGTTPSYSSTSGAMVVTGGVGIGGNLNVGANLQVNNNITATNSISGGSVFDSGNRVVTSVTPTAGVGIGLTNVATSGTATTFTISNTGVTTATGSTYIGVSTSSGNVVFTNLGVTSLTAGTDTVITTSTGNITIWDSSTLQSVTSRGASTTNPISITSALASTNTGSGALQVVGGVGVGGNLNVGAIIKRVGTVYANAWGTNGVGITNPAANYTDLTSTGAISGVSSINSLGVPTIVATGGTPTYANAATLYIDGAPIAGAGVTGITNAYALYINNGNVLVGSNTVSSSPTSGALVVTGGVGVGGALNVSGTITAGTAGSGSVVNGFASNNALIASYTGAAITTGGTVTLDTWSVTNYRTAQYLIQLTDTGYSPYRVHVTQISVLHDGSSNIYKTEYGVNTTVGELGTFDFSISGSTMQLLFTPSSTLAPSNLVVKAYRTSITA